MNSARCSAPWPPSRSRLATTRCDRPAALLRVLVHDLEQHRYEGQELLRLVAGHHHDLMVRVVAQLPDLINPRLHICGYDALLGEVVDVSLEVQVLIGAALDCDVH